MSEETVTFNLEINLEPTYSEIRKFEAVLMRSLTLLNRFTGGNATVQQTIQIIERLITTVRMLQVAIRAFEVAAGPLGWAYFGVTALSTGVYLLDPVLEMNAR
jgi:uncharacterized protein YaaW (UPF0174 family)